MHRLTRGSVARSSVEFARHQDVLIEEDQSDIRECSHHRKELSKIFLKCLVETKVRRIRRSKRGTNVHENTPGTYLHKDFKKLFQSVLIGSLTTPICMRF